MVTVPVVRPCHLVSAAAAVAGPTDTVSWCSECRMATDFVRPATVRCAISTAVGIVFPAGDTGRRTGTDLALGWRENRPVSTPKILASEVIICPKSLVLWFGGN